MYPKSPSLTPYFLRLLLLACASVIPLYSQTAVALIPPTEFQAINANGQPIAGGKVFTYAAGTTTPLATYTDSTGSVPNSNPVILDTAGRASIWISNAAYKIIVQDANGVVQWSQDNVTAINFTGVTTPVPVNQGGTGATSLTGVLQGNGTGPVTGTALGSQTQVLRVQPNATPTLQFANLPIYSAPDYQFSEAPGGSVTGGTPATVTLAPCPLGVTTSSTHKVYLTGGTGTAEAVLVTGGTCTSGASSGTIAFTPANSHSGAWTVQSATGGIQEAVCAAAGGTVTIPAGSYTIFASVDTCLAADPVIEKLSGATISAGGFTILGSSTNAGSSYERFTTRGVAYAQLASIAGLNDSFRYSSNNFPFANEFQGTPTPTLQTLVGATNTTTAGTVGTPVVGIGTAGYAWTNAANENAVGMYAAGQLNSETVSPNSSQAWGANFLASNYGASGTDGSAYDGNIYGLEVDVNVLKTAGFAKPIANVNGIWVAGASSTNQQVGYSRALHVGQLGIGAHVPWDAGLYTDDNAAQVGVSLGTTTVANNVGSQQLQFRSRTSGGTNQVESIQADAAGNLSIIPAANALISLQDGSGNGILSTQPGAATVNGGLRLLPAGSQPTCSSSIRDEMWVVQGNGTSTSDSLQVCILTSPSSAYSWHTVF